MGGEKSAEAQSMHIIRLRGPWQFEPLARWECDEEGNIRRTTEHLPPGGQIRLPADTQEALGADFRGVVRFQRRFHRPSGLDALSRVWLIVEHVDAQAEVFLNDSPLGHIVSSQHASLPSQISCQARFNITAALAPQNLLNITVSRPLPDREGEQFTRKEPAKHLGSLIGDVWLEIEEVAGDSRL